MRKAFVIPAFVVALAAGLTACSSSSKSSVGVGTSPLAGTARTATIDTNFGAIVVALDRTNAPKASGRFAELAASGFYNGLTFHRVVPDFIIQGGDPKGDGSGGTGHSVRGETPTDGYPIGSVAAAKTADDPPGTFDCQFFIVTGQQGTQLPPEYARFGKVTAGMDVAKKIEGLAPGGDGPPTKKVVITKITLS